MMIRGSRRLFFAWDFHTRTNAASPVPNTAYVFYLRSLDWRTKEEEATKFGCRDAFRHYGSSHLRAMTEGSSQHALTHLGRRLPTADGRRRATNPSDPGTEWLPHYCSHRILRRRRKRTYGKMSCQIFGENNRTMRSEKNTWSLNQQSLKTEDSEQCIHCLLCPQVDPLRLPFLFHFGTST